MHHIVNSDGTWHCFSQFGAGGYLPGVRTLLGKYMFVQPHTMTAEAEHLIETGVTDCWEKIFIDEECVVITPAHMLVNRILEVLRGSSRYGTTGMGVGIAVNEAIRADPDFYPLGKVGLHLS